MQTVKRLSQSLAWLWTISKTKNYWIHYSIEVRDANQKVFGVEVNAETGAVVNFEEEDDEDGDDDENDGKKQKQMKKKPSQN